MRRSSGVAIVVWVALMLAGCSGTAGHRAVASVDGRLLDATSLRTLLPGWSIITVGPMPTGYQPSLPVPKVDPECADDPTGPLGSTIRPLETAFVQVAGPPNGSVPWIGSESISHYDAGDAARRMDTIRRFADRCAQFQSNLVPDSTGRLTAAPGPTVGDESLDVHQSLDSPQTGTQSTDAIFIRSGDYLITVSMLTPGPLTGTDTTSTTAVANAAYTRFSATS